MSNISRRSFIGKSAAAAIGLSIPWNLHEKNNILSDKPRIKKFKPLGKTGFKVSDISLGSVSNFSELGQQMFESGINYVDLEAALPNTESSLGKILPQWRDKVFVTTKWDPAFKRNISIMDGIAVYYKNAGSLTLKQDDIVDNKPV